MLLAHTPGCSSISQGVIRALEGMASNRRGFAISQSTALPAAVLAHGQRRSMYLPSLFEESDWALTQQIMRENSLATVITHGPELLANPAPTLVQQSDTGVCVEFHLAVRNPQCHHLIDGATCLLTFTGPNCYVSPSWYSEQPNVPSWNYVSVHAYGSVEVLPEAELERFLTVLTRRHEATVAGSFRYEELPDDFRRELLAEIRGFRVRVSRLEAKAKLSQNRTEEDRTEVTRRLLASADVGAQSVGRWMVRKFGPPT